MIQKIKTDIEKKLENIYSLDFFYLRSEISKILRQYTESKKIFEFSVVCDNTNNQNIIKNTAFFDVYIKENNYSQIIILSFCIKGNISTLRRKLRKEKLKKIYEKAIKI